MLAIFGNLPLIFHYSSYKTYFKSMLQNSWKISQSFVKYWKKFLKEHQPGISMRLLVHCVLYKGWPRVKGYIIMDDGVSFLLLIIILFLTQNSQVLKNLQSWQVVNHPSAASLCLSVCLSICLSVWSANFAKNKRYIFELCD